MIIDAGPLISTERNRRALAILMQAERTEGRTLTTTEAVVARVWRGGPTQANLAAALKAIEIEPEFGSGRRVGELCAATETSDVVDASLVILARQRREAVLTSDLEDLRRLGEHAHVEIIAWDA